MRLELVMPVIGWSGVVLTGVIAGCALIAACQRTDDPTAERIQQGIGVPVFVDPQTGCQYLGYSTHGLTPRLRRDGTPMCGTDRAA